MYICSRRSQVHGKVITGHVHKAVEKPHKKANGYPSVPLCSANAFFVLERSKWGAVQ